MITLEKGKLYQVRHWEKGWIIAEYIGKIEAHIAVGRRSDGATRWHEPASHHWREVVGSSFGLLHKGMTRRFSSLPLPPSSATLRDASATYQSATPELGTATGSASGSVKGYEPELVSGSERGESQAGSTPKKTEENPKSLLTP